MKAGVEPRSVCFSFPSGGEQLCRCRQEHRPGLLGAWQGTMPGKAAVAVALQPSGNDVSVAPQKSFPFVLKKIMDIPPPNILEEGDDGEV